MPLSPSWKTHFLHGLTAANAIGNRNVKDALDAARQLETRLDAFRQVGEHIRDADGNLRDRIEIWHRRTQQTATKLAELHSKLEQVRRPAEWDRAMCANNLKPMRETLDEAKRIDPEFVRLPEVRDLDQRLTAIAEWWQETNAQLKKIESAFRGPTPEEERALAAQNDPAARVPKHLEKLDEVLKFAPYLRNHIKGNPLHLNTIGVFYEELLKKQPVTYDIDLQQEVVGVSEYERIALTRKDELVNWVDWLTEVQAQCQQVEEMYAAGAQLREKGIEPRAGAPLQTLRNYANEKSRLKRAQVICAEAARLGEQAQALMARPPATPSSRLAQELQTRGGEWRKWLTDLQKQIGEEGDLIASDIQYIVGELPGVTKMINDKRKPESDARLKELEKRDPTHPTVVQLRRAWLMKFGKK